MHFPNIIQRLAQTQQLKFRCLAYLRGGTKYIACKLKLNLKWVDTDNRFQHYKLKIPKIEEVTTLMRVSVVFLEPDKGGSGMKS